MECLEGVQAARSPRVLIIRSFQGRLYSAHRPTILFTDISPRILVVVRIGVPDLKDYLRLAFFARRKVLICEPQHQLGRAKISFECLCNESR